jgi:hypothetical protein
MGLEAMAIERQLGQSGQIRHNGDRQMGMESPQCQGTDQSRFQITELLNREIDNAPISHADATQHRQWNHVLEFPGESGRPQAPSEIGR